MRDRWYVSGPMTGVPNKNRANFEALAALVKRAGHTALIPPGANWVDATWADHVLADLHFVSRVGGVVLLPGWRDAPACRLEVAVAALHGLPVMDAVGGFVFNPDDDDPREFIGHLLGCTPTNNTEEAE